MLDHTVATFLKIKKKAKIPAVEFLFLKYIRMPS